MWVVRVTTGFDPEVHGFGFGNRFSGGAVVSELARRGLLEKLTGLMIPPALSTAISLVRDASFWGTFGLCGGMCWAALDRYLSGQPVPTQASPPGPDSDLFGSLVTRQAHSMEGRAMMARCLRWQVMPDSGWWWPWTVGGLTERGEWPKLKLALDAGRPESLCLIRAKGLASPASHHQVVAIGYELEASELTVFLYDPNHPRSRPSLSLRLGHPRYRIEVRQSTGEPLRGFFVWPYRPEGGPGPTPEG